MSEFLRVVRDIALLAARLVAGVTLLVHGWHRWQGTGLDWQVELITQAGLPSAGGLVIATVAFELIGGALLLFGLGTPLIGLGIAVLNVATILTTKWEAGFGIADGGWEYNAMQAVVGLVLLTHGSGRLGVDHLFLRPKGEDDEFIEEHPAAQLPHS